jgi:hypothetical protein
MISTCVRVREVNQGYRNESTVLQEKGARRSGGEGAYGTRSRRGFLRLGKPSLQHW